MLILLPPSEGKAAGGTGPAWTPASGSHPELAEMRRRITTALTRHTPTPLGLTGARADHATTRNQTLTSTPTLPAHQRYTGVVLTSAHLDTLPSAARDRAHDTCHFVSGLGGLFAWNDPVPEYRLKMGARLETIGKLAHAWQDLLTARIEDLGGPVLDLLPVEHAQAITRPRGVHWARLELTSSTGKPAGHAGKAAKGQLLRMLLTSTDPEADAHEWASPDGYRVHVTWTPATRADGSQTADA